MPLNNAMEIILRLKKNSLNVQMTPCWLKLWYEGKFAFDFFLLFQVQLKMFTKDWWKCNSYHILICYEIIVGEKKKI